MFIRGPNLQYPGYPVICLRRGFAGAGRQRVLPFHGCLVRHIDKVFSVVFDTIDYTVAIWLAARSPDVARDVREVTLTNEAVVACHVEPLLAGVDGVVELQGLARLEFAFGMEDGVLRLDLFVVVFLGFVMLPLLRLGAVPLIALRLRDDGDGEGTVGTILVRDSTIRS